MEKTQYVTYYVAQQQRGGLRPIFASPEGIESTEVEQNHPPILQEYLSRNPNALVIESFIEIPDNRKNEKWTQLQKAIDACKRKGASLLIVELGNLTSNEKFTHLLLESQLGFLCIDQPFVNHTILEALSKHAQVQKKLHGKLIREGLKMTSAKSGNPNAAEVISKVNKPKIDTAIVFAFLLQPIILDYRNKNYSQRQMVKMLNDEGFTAPEGGKWVLSQLQKVLDRVRLNEIATEVKSLYWSLVNEEKSAHDIALALNSKNIPAIKRGQWDESQVKKLEERIKQIEEIEQINQFVLHLLPLLHHYRKLGLSPNAMMQEFQKADIRICQDSLAA